MREERIMAVQGNTVDVSEIVENQKLSGFLIGLVVISWIITFFDGFDMIAVGFVARPMMKEFHLGFVEMGNVFSIGLVGTLIGGFGLGWIADRIGRRPSVIWATFAFGVLTILFAFAGTYSHLLILRLIDGIAIGGMLPVAWALNIEYAPKRYRSTIVTVIMVGYSFGAATGGPVANWLVPTHGWPAVFVFGGVLSILASIALFFTLPESVRFLTTKRRNPARIAAILRRIAPERTIPANANFVLADEGAKTSDFKPSILFQGPLKWITPMLWIAYIFSSMTAFFGANWGPVVVQSLGFSQAAANWSGTANSIAGVLGGLMLMRFTDNKGAIAITFMPLLAIPFLLWIAFGSVAAPQVFGLSLFFYLSFISTLFLIGGHFGLHSIAGIFYPSAYRSNGAGWATSVAKIGSIIGPFVGGYILASSIPRQQIFGVMAICPAVFVVAILVVGTIQSRMMRRAHEAGGAAAADIAAAAGD
jgi:AAHS family 4-hydroxybenzoate transporter-like MFS transporter